jgi:hypothetical protein
MKCDQLDFAQAYDCGLSPQGGAVVLKKTETHPEDKGEGCYLVTVDSEVAYIGSYESGAHKRWGYKKKDDVYHFKWPEIGKAIKKGKAVRIWALTLDAIKEQIGCPENKWINAASVEAYLISKYRPLWNKQGKRA